MAESLNLLCGYVPEIWSRNLRTNVYIRIPVFPLVAHVHESIVVNFQLRKSISSLNFVYSLILFDIEYENNKYNSGDRNRNFYSNQAVSGSDVVNHGHLWDKLFISTDFIGMRKSGYTLRRSNQ